MNFLPAPESSPPSIQVDDNSLSSYLDTLLLGLQGDGNSLGSFVSTFSRLALMIRSRRDSMQAETLVGIRKFVSVVDTIASNLLELERESEKVGDQFLADIPKVLHKQMGNLTLTDGPYPELLEGTSHLPAYIKPSYEWLLSNLHNPYPSKKVKADIARQSKCSVRDIDSWFIDARKRIGWNTLRRQQFSNKQDRIINAATRFFKPSTHIFTDDLSVTLDTELDLDDAYDVQFTAMEDAARSLYSGRYVDMPPSTSLSNLSAPRSTAPNNGPQVGKRAPFQHANARSFPDTELSSRDILQGPAASYPTPEPSPALFVELSPTASPHITQLHEPDVRSRKRRLHSIESAEEGEADLGDLLQPRKKPKVQSLDSADVIETTTYYGLPSPAPSAHPLEEPLMDMSQPAEISNCSATTAAASSAKRKRRLSEGNSQKPVKRPYRALGVSRLQAVSDSFLIAGPLKDDSFDKWFDGNFAAERQLDDAITSTENLEVPDFTDNVHLDVHCYNYDTSLYQPDFALHKTNSLSRHDVSPEVPDEVLKTSVHEGDFLSVISASDFSPNLDFDFLPSFVRTDTQDVSFDLHPPTTALDALVQAPSINYDWMQFSLGDSVDIVEHSSFCTAGGPSLSDFDLTSHDGLNLPEDQDARCLRLQYLREELRLLESEVGS